MGSIDIFNNQSPIEHGAVYFPMKGEVIDDSEKQPNVRPTAVTFVGLTVPSEQNIGVAGLGDVVSELSSNFSAQFSTLRMERKIKCLSCGGFNVQVQNHRHSRAGRKIVELSAGNPVTNFRSDDISGDYGSENEVSLGRNSKQHTYLKNAFRRIRRNTSPGALDSFILPDDDDDEPLLDITTRVDDHCHSSVPNTAHISNRTAQRQLFLVCVICLTFMVLEVIGGVISGSLAIMTDAAHLLSDFAGFCISLFALWVARKPATVRMSFGYYRAEVMGAVLSVLIIWVLTGVLIYLAVLRIINSDYNIDANIMLITAGIGILINIVLIAILQYTGHSHSHGGSHSHVGSSSHSHDGSSSHSHDDSSSTDSEVNPGKADLLKAKKNLNVRAALIHCIGDFVQSIGVFAAALFIKFGGKKFQIADPICTFLFSVIVLFTTLTILRDAVHVLMEGVPRNINYNALRSELGKVPGVRMAHGLHVWSLTTSCIALAVHLAVDPGTDTQEVLNIASERVRNKFNIVYSTIQVEDYQEEVMSQCSQCQGPC